MTNPQLTAVGFNNAEKLKAFLQRLGTRQGYSLSLRLFSIVPEVLARETKQEKEINTTQTGMEGVNMFLFAYGSYIKNAEDSTI